MRQYIESFHELLVQSPLGNFPLLVRFIDSCVEVVTGPLTGLRTAHYWVFVLMSLAVVALVFVLRFRRQAEFGVRGFMRFCFPQDILTHSSTMTDIKLKFINNFVMPMVNVTWRFNAAWFTGFLLSGLIATCGPPLKIFEWNFTAMVVFTILLAIAQDLGFYLCHLAHHRIPVLWAFHKVHHSAEVMTPLTSTRAHPLELMLIPPSQALMGSLVMVPALYLFDTPPTLVELFGINLVVLAFNLAGGALGHSHVWITWPPALQRIFVCPALHQIHHSSALRHHDKNLAAMFSFWDWVFGTLYIAPREREPFTLGIHGEARQPHPGVVAAYVVPFQDAARAVMPWLPAPLGRWLAGARTALHERLTARQPASPTALPPNA